MDWLQEKVDQNEEGRLCLFSSLNPLDQDEEEEETS